MDEYLCNDTERTMIGVGSILHVSIHAKMRVDYQRLSLASEHHTLTSMPTSVASHYPVSEMKTSDCCLLAWKADSRAKTNTSSGVGNHSLEMVHLKLKLRSSYQECSRPRWYKNEVEMKPGLGKWFRK